MSSSKDALKIQVLMEEYRSLHADVRMMLIFTVSCIVLAVLTSIIFISVGLSTGQHILFLITPAVSLFLALLAAATFAMTINTALRIAQIEEEVNAVLNEPVMKWEETGGVFPKVGEDPIVTKIMKYIEKVGILGLIAGVTPTFIGLALGNGWLFERIGALSYLVIVAYAAAGAIALYFTVNFTLYRSWEKLEYKAG